MDDCPEIVVANSLALDFPNHSPVYLDVSQKVDARRISQRSCIEMPSIKDMELAALSLRVEVGARRKDIHARHSKLVACVLIKVD